MEKEAGLERLYNQAAGLIVDMQMIADSLFDYNSGLCKKKIPLSAIQCDCSTLARNLIILYGDIGEKIRNEAGPNS